MKKYLIALSVAFSLMVCSVSHAADAMALRLKLQAGDKYELTFNQENTMVQNMMGQEIDMTQNSSMWYTMEVKDVEESGNMRIATTLDRVKMSGSTLGNAFAYDSDDPNMASSEQAQAFAPMLGREMIMLMTPRGETLEVEGLDEMFDSMFEEDTPQAQQMKEQFKDMYSDQGFKNMMSGGAFSMYPEEPKAVGDKWKDSATFKNPLGEMAIDSDVSLVAHEDGVITMQMDSTFSTSEDSEGIELESVKMNYDIKDGSQVATLLIDENTGWMIETNIEQKMSAVMYMDMSGAPNAPPEMQNLTVPMEMTNKGTMKSRKI